MTEINTNENLINWNSLRPVEQLYCCAIADDDEWHSRDLRRLYEQCGDEKAFDFARRNHAVSVVGLALRSVLKQAVLPQRWNESMEQVCEKLTLYLGELDAVAEAFARQGIKLIALKNSGIARGIFPHLAGCPMGDVDVLVELNEFRCAHSCMLKLGYTLDSRNPLEVEGLEEAEKEGGVEYFKTLPDNSKFWFELQWRPVAGRWIQPHQEPLAADLIARSISVPETKVRILSPVDNLLQVCLHTAKHTFVRAPGFRLHTDVDRIVRRSQLDWSEFEERVNCMEVRTAVYFSLRIPHDLLATPVPEKILSRLKPMRWKEKIMLGWIRRVGYFNPDIKKWSKVGYIIFNLLLYDNLAGIWRAVIPDAESMCEQYNIKHHWTLPWFYGLRIWNLTFKRANT